MKLKIKDHSGFTEYNDYMQIQIECILNSQNR